MIRLLLLLTLFCTACSSLGRGAITWDYEVVGRYPHDVRHFTQGLFWHEGDLFESTGGYGSSGLYRKRLEDGAVIQSFALPRHLFGEGITLHENRIWQLTWREGVGLIYDLDFTPRARFALTTEGWGLSGDGRRLWMTDGSARLLELDPDSGQIIGHVTVRDAGRPVTRLNELEYIEGRMLANVFMSDRIVVFDPESGEVEAWLDLSELRREVQERPGFDPLEDVLNGIAWDPERRLLLVTGKRWPTLFALSVPALRGRSEQ